MKLAVDTISRGTLRERLDALLTAARATVGEVYFEGARNAKLGHIHAAGAVLRSGAATRLKTVSASDVRTHADRAVLRRSAGGRAMGAGRAGGVIPPRNPFFAEPSDMDRIHRIYREGIREIVEGRSTNLRETMRRAAEWLASAFRRHIAPGGDLSSAHAGLHEPVGTPVGEGERMMPLSPAYAQAKARKRGPRPILVATGELYQSIRSRVAEGAV